MEIMNSLCRNCSSGKEDLREIKWENGKGECTRCGFETIQIREKGTREYKIIPLDELDEDDEIL